MSSAFDKAIDDVVDLEELRTMAKSLIGKVDEGNRTISTMYDVIQSLKYDVLMLAVKYGDWTECAHGHDVIEIQIPPDIRALVASNKDTYDLNAMITDEGGRIIQIHDEGDTHGNG